jgi:peroxiredoxin
MRILALIILLPCLLTVSIHGNAQVIGDFSLPDVKSGKDISLASYAGKKAVVVIFTSLECPFDQYYVSRIDQFINKFSSKGVQVLLVNSIPSETGADLKGRIPAWKAPYLTDKQQVVMRLLNASKSPEAFILVPVKGGFRKLYQGAIDNNPQVENDVKKPYLEQNLTDILAGDPMTYADILPVGCRIRTP